jgi:hypothetical protein
MSIELSYFPPSKTDLKWNHKELNYSPWVCDISQQLYLKQSTNNTSLWPMRVFGLVDFIEGYYTYKVEVVPWVSQVF